MFGKNKEKEQTTDFKKEQEAALAVANAHNLEAEAAEKRKGIALEDEKKAIAKLETTTERLITAKSDLAEAENKRDTAQTEATQEGVKQDDLKKEREEEESKLKEVQGYLVDLEQAKSDETAKFEGDIKTLTHEKATAEAGEKKAKSDLKAAENRHQARLAEIDEEIVETEERGKVAEEETKKAEKRVGGFESTIEGLQEDITDAEGILKELKEEIKTAQHERDTAITEKETAEKELVGMTDKIKGINDEKFALAGRTQRLDEREALIKENYIRAGVEYPTN